MARIYSRTSAIAVDDPQFGHFERDKDHGGFDLPDELSDRMLAVHHRGKPAWEDQPGRDERLHGEETARQRDPATLYGAVENLVKMAQGRPSGAADGEVAELRKQVEALTARLAAMGQSSDDDSGDEESAPARASRSRRTTSK